jgi:hypothetical protein
MPQFCTSLKHAVETGGMAAGSSMQLQKGVAPPEVEGRQRLVELLAGVCGEQCLEL